MFRCTHSETPSNLQTFSVMVNGLILMIEFSCLSSCKTKWKFYFPECLSSLYNGYGEKKKLKKLSDFFFLHLIDELRKSEKNPFIVK